MFDVFQDFTYVDCSFTTARRIPMQIPYRVLHGFVFKNANSRHTMIIYLHFITKSIPEVSSIYDPRPW